MLSRRSPTTFAVLAIGTVGSLAALAGLIGFGIGHYTHSAVAPSATSSVPAPSLGSHSGADLPAHEFGDPARGAKMFVSKGCAICHSYAGRGGSDGPALDNMAGHLSAREIANMSGTIWNHLPVMLPRFRKEGIPLPTFTGDQMADLIAYLHSKPSERAAPSVPSGTPMPSGTMDGGARPGNLARGKTVFTTLGCGSCHALAVAGTTGTVGPDLGSLRKGKSTAAYIERSILEPNAVVVKGYPANVMPAFGATITKQQLADVVALLTGK